jgi:hypothetical protein
MRNCFRASISNGQNCQQGIAACRPEVLNPNPFGIRKGRLNEAAANLLWIDLHIRERLLTSDRVWPMKICHGLVTRRF